MFRRTKFWLIQNFKQRDHTILPDKSQTSGHLKLVNQEPSSIPWRVIGVNSIARDKEYEKLLILYIIGITKYII